MKILYLNHICWEWIFQRPQILALLLQEDYDVTVVNKKFIFWEKIDNKNPYPKKFKNVIQLPKAHLKVIRSINHFLYKLQLHDLKKYDAIWICHPDLYRYVPSDYSGKIIYDCMDDHVAMSDDRNSNEIEKMEIELVKKASVIFASSNSLKNRIIELNTNVFLIRNGFISNEIIHVDKSKNGKDIYSIGYFGTVSSWFDFKLLKESLKKNANIRYNIIGPVENGLNILKHDRINYLGVKNHDDLPSLVSSYDALIMPFVINDIILSVDPVKLYEYIACGKCVISIWYPEIDRFEPYVYFYKDENDYQRLISYLINIKFVPKYDYKMQMNFLNENSWEQRYKIIKDNLKKSEID